MFSLRNLLIYIKFCSEIQIKPLQPHTVTDPGLLTGCCEQSGRSFDLWAGAHGDLDL